MKRDPVKAEVLATKIIPNVSPDMAKELNLEPGMKSLALITSTSDDVTYTALDEATKKADVKVVYAKSFYAGADNANTKLAGEIIGMLAGPNPAEVRSGLEACVDVIENQAILFPQMKTIRSFITHTVFPGPVLICQKAPVSRRGKLWLISSRLLWKLCTE